jgi:hypothetical protein
MTSELCEDPKVKKALEDQAKAKEIASKVAESLDKANYTPDLSKPVEEEVDRAIAIIKKADPTERALAILENGAMEEMKGIVKDIIEGIKADLDNPRTSVWITSIRDDGDVQQHIFPNGDNLRRTFEPGGIRERWPSKVREIVEDLVPPKEKDHFSKLAELAKLAKKQLPEKSEPGSQKKGSEASKEEVKKENE